MARDKYQWTTGRVFGVGLALMFVGFLVFMGPLQWAYESYGPEWMRAEPEDLPEGSQRVDVFITQKEAIGGAAENQIIRVYDSNLAFIEEVTPSSGKATCTQPYWEGETINLQVRPADPNSASYTHYMSPMTSYVIPQADVNGDAIIAGPDVWETSTSVVTFTAFNQTMQGVTGAAPNCITIDDTKVHVFTVITDNCAYGTPFDFTDAKSGDSYKAGAWLIMKSSTEQDITNAYAEFSGTDYWYYIFERPMGVEDAVNAANSIPLLWNILCPSGFVASTTVTLDIFDTCKLNSDGSISISSFIDGDSNLNPAVITTAITVGT